MHICGIKTIVCIYKFASEYARFHLLTTDVFSESVLIFIVNLVKLDRIGKIYRLQFVVLLINSIQNNRMQQFPSSGSHSVLICLIWFSSQFACEVKYYFQSSIDYYHPRMWVGNVFGHVCMCVCPLCFCLFRL